MDTSDAFEIISYKPCAKLAYNTPAVCYTLVRIPEDPTQGRLDQIADQNSCDLKLKINALLNC